MLPPARRERGRPSCPGGGSLGGGGLGGGGLGGGGPLAHGAAEGEVACGGEGGREGGRAARGQRDRRAEWCGRDAGSNERCRRCEGGQRRGWEWSREH
jgi:hypothetical protein